MTDDSKIALFQWVSLRDRRISFGLIGGRVVLVFGGRTPPGSQLVERLDAVVVESEGVTSDGLTLNVGALGILRIAEHLGSMPTYGQSGRALHERVCDLFAGSAFFPEMLAATIRLVCELPDVGGDTPVYMSHAHRQMQTWSAGKVTVAVMQTVA